MSVVTNVPIGSDSRIECVQAVQATNSGAELRKVLRRPLNALTSARFFAAFYVVLFHFGTRAAVEHGAPRIVCTFFANGWMGVAFFFLLSGFILTYSYTGQMTSTGDRRRFWEARFARVYPVYLLSLMVNWPFRGSMTWGTMAAVLTATQTWNPWKSYLAEAWNYPAWTLSVEAFFYLCFPLILWGCVRLSPRARLIIGGIVLSIVVFCHTSIPVERVSSSWAVALGIFPIPVARLPEFILGVLLAQRFLERKPAFSLGRALIWFLGALFLLSTLRGDWLSVVVIPFAGLLYELASMKSEDMSSIPGLLMSTG